MLILRRCAVLAAACCAMGAAWAQLAAREPIRALPPVGPIDSARVALGRMLFHSTRFSADGRLSCASCHKLAQGGADDQPFSRGFQGRPTAYNTPTVYNSTLNYGHAWSGRDVSPERRIDRLIEDPAIFASNWPALLARLAADPVLSAQFQSVYDEGPSAGGVSDALQHYLRSLATPSRFDRYLGGDAKALSADEKAGYARFKSFGCAACHQGVNVGGNMLQKFGSMRELPGLNSTGADLGRFQVTGRDSDRRVFRVPSLRNVALTAPYFHNGSVATLEEAVDVMFRYQLGRRATARDKALIVRFLHTLSGETMPPRGALP